MGYYGDEKIRQMVRSILPSRAAKRTRQGANQRRRKNRRVAGQYLTPFRGAYATDACDMFEDSTVPYDYYMEMHHATIHWDYSIVSYRREADKLNHFERWAREITKDLDPIERYDYMARIIADRPMGGHAMSHLKYVVGYKHEAEMTYSDYYQSHYRRSRVKLSEKLERLFWDLREIADSPTKLAAFNRAMTQHCSPYRYEIPVTKDTPGARLRREQVYRNRTFGTKSKTVPTHVTTDVWYLERQCDAVRTIRGYHDVRAFMRDVIRGYDLSLCDGVHRHDWVSAVWKCLGRSADIKFMANRKYDLSHIGKREKER